MTHSTSPILGVNFDERTADAKFALGTTTQGSDGYDYVYVQANGAIAASQTDITVSGAFQASDGGAGTYVSSAVAFADNEYGWVRSPVLSAPAS